MYKIGFTGYCACCGNCTYSAVGETPTQLAENLNEVLAAHWWEILDLEEGETFTLRNEEGKEVAKIRHTYGPGGFHIVGH